MSVLEKALPGGVRLTERVLSVMSSTAADKPGRAVRILLVEDSLTHIEMIRDALAVCGRQISLTVAGTLAEARASLAVFQPDLAIVDLFLPDGSGIELLAAAREEATFPIVILTGHDNRGEAVAALKAGALDYLVKSPETLDDMPHIVERTLQVWDHIVERRRADKALREANRELDAFVYTVSHDLRSPLTPIIGYAEYLQEKCLGRLDEEAMQILTEIVRQGHRMQGLLEDLLALARVGHLERPGEPVDGDDVAREVIAGYRSRLADLGMTVEIGALPVLRVPRTLLAQVLDNLVGNAVRYAGRAGETIVVGGERQGARVRFYVRDRGPGIPAEERGRVFDLFYRGSAGSEIAGTGVGLATVQKIARLYGGRAWVEETAGGGSTFWVEMVDEGEGAFPPAG
jgi:signal transduction histidine kinase